MTVFPSMPSTLSRASAIAPPGTATSTASASETSPPSRPILLSSWPASSQRSASPPPTLPLPITAICISLSFASLTSPAGRTCHCSWPSHAPPAVPNKPVRRPSLCSLASSELPRTPLKRSSQGELTYPIAPALMLQVAGRGIGHSLRIANISLQQEGIHHRAYLSIGVTSSSGVGLCGMSGGVISWGTGGWPCRILDMNFREYLFYDVGCIALVRIHRRFIGAYYFDTGRRWRRRLAMMC